MSSIDLTCDVGTFLKLRHPLWIASAHYSEKESVIDAWVDYEPAALTLKTSHKAPKTESKDSVRQKTYPTLPRFGRSFYCDGPKHKELHSYDNTAKLLQYAVDKLPNTKVGVSVIASPDQDYPDFRSRCAKAAFAELNLKYSFRLAQTSDSPFFQIATTGFKSLLEEVTKFTKAFADLPVFIKISRELDWIPRTKELDEFLDILKAHSKAGLIVANSLKLKIPTFLSNRREESLHNGVICGEYLFDQTISLIEQLKEPCEKRSIPIVATGGMIDPENILMALRAGASAVQLCTAFDYYGFNYYNTVCWNLQNRIEVRGLPSFSKYLSRLRDESVASIYNMPFMYFEKFWSDDIQARLKNDVRSSGKMTVFVMSGRTVFERWKEVLKQRFERNLGTQLLLPNPDGSTYAAIQRAWGIVDKELEARIARVKQTQKKFAELWKEAEPTRRASLKEDQKETALQILDSDQCPFYSFYLFDDKVYVAPYPFVRPGELDSPVYVFFTGSKEFERITKEADFLVEFARQTSTSQS